MWRMSLLLLFVCLFGFIRPTWECFTHMEMSPLQVKAANFGLCSAVMTIEQWGLFIVPHLMWHGVSVYNGHLRRRVTLTRIAELLAVELSLPVFTTNRCPGWDSNTQASACCIGLYSWFSLAYMIHYIVYTSINSKGRAHLFWNLKVHW